MDLEEIYDNFGGKEKIFEFIGTLPAIYGNKKISLCLVRQFGLKFSEADRVVKDYWKHHPGYEINFALDKSPD